jgi:hypothetical protein
MGSVLSWLGRTDYIHATPLNTAIANSYAKLVKILLEHVEPIRAKDSLKENVLKFQHQKTY